MKMFKIIFFTLLFGSVCYGQNNAHVHEEESHQGHGHEKETQEGRGNDHKKKLLDDENHDEHDGHKEDEGGHAEHDGHEGHGNSKAIGKGKAIEEVDERKGFKMSKEAKKTIGVKLRKLSEGPVVIPKEALVVSLNKRGIYRYRNGFFKMLPVKIKGEDKNTFIVTVEGLKNGDEIAVDGVGLLRVTDIYSTDTSEYGHGH